MLTIIGTLTSLPIKSIRIISQDANQSMCTLELHSVFESTQLFNLISSIAGGFVIDDSLVSLAYAPRVDHSAANINSIASQSAAMAALAAAQWKNQDESGAGKSKLASSKAALGMVTVNGLEYMKYSPPDYSSFVLDANSGYYYDHSTGFYYDSNSTYFYNSVSASL